jgi:hypothetical protein
MKMKPMRVLSLGWGVQSWTLAAMAALGEIEPVDFAIHADTTHEASATYAHAEKWTPWLEKRGVHVVTVKPEYPSLLDRFGGVMIPAFTVDNKGNNGVIRRQCTNKWKIVPVRKYMRSMLSGPPKPGDIQLMLGISWDEALRMKASDVQYVTHEYPLVDTRTRRTDCIQWLEQHNLDVPQKSSCVFCPYRNKKSWADLKRNGGHDWDHAVEVDSYIRHKRTKGEGLELFVHSYRKPLAEAITIPEDIGAQQLNLLDTAASCDSGYCFT